MSHDLNILEKLADEGSHSKCRQAVLHEDGERPVEKLRFGEERGRGSRKRRTLKLQRDEDVRNGERDQRESCFWVWRRMHGCNSGIFVRGQEPGEGEGGARWKDVRLGGKSEFLVTRETPVARRSHEALKRERGKEGREGLGGRERRLNCRTFENWRAGGSCARRKMS